MTTRHLYPALLIALLLAGSSFAIGFDQQRLYPSVEVPTPEPVNTVGPQAPDDPPLIDELPIYLLLLPAWNVPHVDSEHRDRHPLPARPDLLTDPSVRQMDIYNF